MKLTFVLFACLIITALSLKLKKNKANLKQNDNLVNNGDFSQPAFNGGWGFISPPQGWEIIFGEMEVGAGGLYNGNWGSAQVVEIDGNQNSVLGAHIKIEGAAKCHVNFDFAGRVGASNGLMVYWNDEVVLDDSNPSQDWSIHHLSKDVDGKAGDNLLKFVGVGASDSLGETFSHVSVTCDKPSDC